MTEVAEVHTVPFNGDEVLAVLRDGKPHVILKPIVERLGLDWSSQLAKLKGKSWGAMAMSTIHLPGFTRPQSVTVVPIRTLVMLLATIDENRVAEHVRPALVTYQAEVADVLEAHFTAEYDELDRAAMIIDQLREQRRINREIEARVSALEENYERVSALGYAKNNGLPCDLPFLQRLGIAAGRIGRREGIAIVKGHSTIFGTVNTWPDYVWDEALIMIRGA